MSKKEEQATQTPEQTDITEPVTEALEKPLTEQQVVEYLRTSTDLFQRNPSMLCQMEIPHDSGNGTISLIEHQTRILRDQNAQLKTKLMDLVRVARDNDHLAERMMQLTLALIEANGLGQILKILDSTLNKEFRADLHAIRLFDLSPELQQQYPNNVALRDGKTLEIFSDFFNSNRPLCGRLRKAQMEFLFADADNENRIESSVLIPLGNYGSFGMIAIGSKDKNRFHPGMGTVFLKQMGILISAMLKQHLAKPTVDA